MPSPSGWSTSLANGTDGDGGGRPTLAACIDRHRRRPVWQGAAVTDGARCQCEELMRWGMATEVLAMKRETVVGIACSRSSRLEGRLNR
jgi:hypothetical protein